jgi:hypothetical protein
VSDHDPATEDIRAAAAAPDASDRLARLGVGWALVYSNDPLTPELPLTGLQRVTGGHEATLYRVPGKVALGRVVPAWRRTVVIGVDLAVLLAWLLSCVLATRQRYADSLRGVVRRRSRNGVS